MMSQGTSSLYSCVSWVFYKPSVLVHFACPPPLPSARISDVQHASMPDVANPSDGTWRANDDAMLPSLL